MDDQHKNPWYMELLGPQGGMVRDELPQIVGACHERLSDSQDASGMRSKGVYGQIWRAIFEAFEDALMKYSGAQRIHPKGANYRLVAIGNTIIFPWRFGRDASQNLQDTPFALSGARLAAFSTPYSEAHPELDLGLFQTEPDYQDDMVQSDLKDLMSENFKVVLVAFSSRPGSLHSLEWGEATLGADGCIVWGENEQLIAPQATTLAALEETEAFDQGAVPSVFVIRKEAGAVSDE